MSFFQVWNCIQDHTVIVINIEKKFILLLEKFKRNSCSIFVHLKFQISVLLNLLDSTGPGIVLSFFVFGRDRQCSQKNISPTPEKNHFILTHKKLDKSILYILLIFIFVNFFCNLLYKEIL